MTFSFQLALEGGERAQMAALELPDPALGDRVDRHRIDEMQLLAALAPGSNEVRLLEDPQMLGDRLACHVEPLAELDQGLSVAAVQAIEQAPAAGVGQGAENGIFCPLGF